MTLDIEGKLMTMVRERASKDAVGLIPNDLPQCGLKTSTARLQLQRKNRRCGSPINQKTPTESEPMHKAFAVQLETHDWSAFQLQRV
jgi:hypothetical protein